MCLLLWQGRARWVGSMRIGSLCRLFAVVVVAAVAVVTV